MFFLWERRIECLAAQHSDRIANASLLDIYYSPCELYIRVSRSVADIQQSFRPSETAGGEMQQCSGALDFVFHVDKNFHAGKLASQIFLASQKLSKILSQQLAKVGTTMEFEMR